MACLDSPVGFADSLAQGTDYEDSISGRWLIEVLLHLYFFQVWISRRQSDGFNEPIYSEN